MSQTIDVDVINAENESLLAEATAIDEQAQAESRDLTDSENKKINSNLSRIKLNRTRLAQAAPDSAPNYPAPQSGTPGLIPQQLSNQLIRGCDGASVNAAMLFGHSVDRGGFASFGEFLQVLDTGRFDGRMVAANKEGIDSEGGFLVPEIYRNMFIDAVIESTILAKRVFRIPMTSETLKLSGIDGNDHSSNLFGGLVGGWEGEIPSLSAQDIKTRQIQLNSKKLIILNQSSNELISDAPSYERMLGSALVKATSWELDYALLRGNGAGQPLGCLNSDSRISVAKQTNQTASTIWYSNCVKMFARLHPASYATALWVINPTCIVELMQMDVHASAGSDSLDGDNQYIPFRERDGKFTLFGRPVEVPEKVPTLGTEGDIMLLDPTQYVLGMRKDVVVEKSIHAGFESDSSYYRSKMRCDAMPLWSKAVTPRNGDDLSWCVTLADRS